MAHLSRILCAASAALALAACTDRTTEPDATSSILNGGPPDASAVKFWEAGAAVGWNGIARGLTIVNPQSPIGGQRIFAYLNLAVYDAVAAVEAAAGHPSPQAAAGGAAVTVLSFFFPGDITALEAALTAQEGGAHWPGELHTTSPRRGNRPKCRPTGRRSDTNRQLQRAVLGYLPPTPLGHVDADAAADVRRAAWFEGHAALLPHLGRPVPAAAALGARLHRIPTGAPGLRDIAANRTLEQATAPLTYLYGPGTSGIAGRWNQEASDLIVSHHFDEIRAAHVFALMHMAAMDAYIACWEAKFVYFIIRPTQADPSISTIVAVPNHPSYPSGHSCNSGASSEVLATLFPDAQGHVRDLADAIGIARFWGGVHYRKDVDVGLALGLTVAQFAATQDVHGHEGYPIP
jgi:hypothetical protein